MEYAQDQMNKEQRKELTLKKRKQKARLRRRRAVAFCVVIIIVLAASKLVIWGVDKITNVWQTANIPADGGDSGAGSDQYTSTGDWELLLVNGTHPVPQGYEPEIEVVDSLYKFDVRAADSLRGMLQAAQKEGLSPIICSAYRTLEKQQALFDNRVQREIANGFSPEQADIQARKVVAYPGTSEHHLGLAVDIVASSYQGLDDAQADTNEMKWLIKHCHEYGFILRYPKDKTEITGVIWEPWHFRYVGKKAAKIIMKEGICLEEYLGAV